MMKLELVSHCWRSRYSRLLIYQLSSLLRFPPQSTDVTMTVFFTPEDAATAEVVGFFTGQSAPANLKIRAWPLPKQQLLRRLIGRNLAALSTTADWVWFTDCDYCFGEGTFDTLAKSVQTAEGPLVMPRHIWVNATHAEGDRLIEAVAGIPEVRPLDTAAFVATSYGKAIGGIQIANGDVVRKLGYCRDSPRHRRPADTWKREVEDVHFRTSLGTSGVPVECPHVFRIRHTPRTEQET